MLNSRAPLNESQVYIKNENGEPNDTNGSYRNLCDYGVYIRFPVKLLDKLQLGNIDAILCTEAQNMLALPYLTSVSGFRAVLIATEAAIIYAQQAFSTAANSIDDGGSTDKFK